MYKELQKKEVTKKEETLIVDLSDNIYEAVLKSNKALTLLKSIKKMYFESANLTDKERIYFSNNYPSICNLLDILLDLLSDNNTLLQDTEKML